MRLPSDFILRARQSVVAPGSSPPPAPAAAPSCDCLSGGAIAGIVIGSIVGSFLLYWLIKYLLSSNVESETITYRGRRYDYPSPTRHRRRSSSYHSTSGRPVSKRRYRRDVIERPTKVYVH